jgi:hypothetical protein
LFLPGFILVSFFRNGGEKGGHNTNLLKISQWTFIISSSLACRQEMPAGNQGSNWKPTLLA